MILEEVKEEMIKLLESKKYTELRELLFDVNNRDISIILQELDIKDLLKMFRLLIKDDAADVFTYMEPEFQEELIHLFTDIELKNVLDDLFLDDTVDLIEEMPSNVVKRILKNVSAEDRKDINEFLNYPRDSAGSIMTNEFVDLKENMTVEEALAKIKKVGVDKETIYTCYVLTESRKLIGVVTAKDLLLSNRDTVIKDIMDTNIISTSTLEDKEDVGHMFGKYDFIALPVVDKENRLVGIITIDDAIDVIEEENTEDFEKMAAITHTADSYFRTSTFKHAKNRFMWLLILMFSATITGAIISNYEIAIASLPVLVSFIPLLMDTGGNCGSQSSTLMIRGMAVGEIKTKDYFRVVWKELKVSLLIGVALSVANGIRIILQYRDMKLTLVVGATLLITIVISKVVGCTLPILAKKFKMDPAIMASPLITTIVDILAVFIYFNIAMAVMNI